MISVELWRATIGLTSSKCYSGSLSSLSCPFPRVLNTYKFRSSTQEEPLSSSTESHANPTSSPEKSSKERLVLPQQSLLSFSWSFLVRIRTRTSFPISCGLHLLQDTLVRLVLAILVIISQSLIISGDIETNPGPIIDAVPTLLKLTTMKGADGKPLRIVQTIAAQHYVTFGMCLLQDENGVVVDLIERNHISKGAEGVTRAIIQKWLTSDAPTRTYQHLIECLRQSELGALAELIEASTSSEQVSTTKTSKEFDSDLSSVSSSHSNITTATGISLRSGRTLRDRSENTTQVNASEDMPRIEDEIQKINSDMEDEIGDLTAYWPSDWLKSTKPRCSPYFPQIGDRVVYFYQGHQLYNRAVHEHPPSRPWKRFTLRPKEVCQVERVHFVAGSPALCSITLALTSYRFSRADRGNHFTFKFCDVAGVLDFIVLEQIYKDSLKQRWSRNDKIKSLVDGEYYFGTVLRKRPFSEDIPKSEWQSFHVRWDDGAFQKLSPWEFISCEADNDDDIFTYESKWNTRDKSRILRGLDDILKKNIFPEAEDFLKPVDLREESLYCTVVAFPTSISTIADRLRNGFYRRKKALIWEVKLLARNARVYNEDGSVIIENGEIVVKTLLKFIRNRSYTSVMECCCDSDTESEPPMPKRQRLEHS